MKKFIDGKVLCVTHNKMLVYNKGKLFLSNLKIPEKIIKSINLYKLYGKSRILTRLLRLEPRCATVLDDSSFLISFKGKIFCYNTETNSLFEEHKFSKGMNNPLGFCVIMSEYGEKEIYYGEYIWNVKKGPVSIYKRKNGVWSKVYEFKAGEITHIHNIIYDHISNIFYILTGDEDNESGIWVADRNFQKVHILIKGKQQYRSCVAFIINNYLYFATDTPLETNHIYRICLNNDSNIKIETVCEIPGPCIYGTKIGKKYFLSTTVEPDSSLPSWRYRITSQLGKGVKDKYSHIIQIDENGNVEECIKLKKDF